MRTFLGGFLLILAVANADNATTNLRHLVYSNAYFSKNLYSAISDGSNNLVCSPLSAQLSLAMIRLGARGRTRLQLTEAFKLPVIKLQNYDNMDEGFRDLANTIFEENKNRGTTIRLANRLYASKNLQILPAFQQAAQNYFGVKARTVDFEDPITAANQINSWVENFTEHKIRNLISPSSLDRSTQLVLVNALYFKSLWKSAFDPRDTRNRTFHLSPDLDIKIPFMYQQGNFRLGHFRNINATILELPYQGDRLSLVIVKPHTVTGLPALEQAFTILDLGHLLRQTRLVQDLEVFLPRFTMEVALQLNEPLKKMGITDMFGSSADLTGIVGRSPSDPPLAVSQVAQKTFIEVTEQGTEAASGTFGTSIFLSAKYNSVVDMNSPFLFYLTYRIEQTNPRIILVSGRFMGQ